MPRILGEAQNELKIKDNLSNSEIVLFYRSPTTEERQAYTSRSVNRLGKTVVIDQAGANLEYGLKILTGIRDGDFVTLKKGNQVPLSSDPKSKNYQENWKEEVEQSASDLVMLLGMQVFDRFAYIVPPSSDLGE